jgi:DNA-binding MarR family transcriptional regulator
MERARESLLGGCRVENNVRTVLLGSRYMRQELERRFAAENVSFAAFTVLDAIAAAPGLNQRAIGRSICSEGPSVTRHLDHLEAAGLVTRQRDATDRRTIRVWLTDAGRAQYDALCPIITAFEAEILAPFTPADLATVTRVLDAIRATLCAVDGSDG